jgi:hypothetical protein
MLVPYVGFNVETRRFRRRSRDDQGVPKGVIRMMVMRELSLWEVCLEE